jgi:hypothetical protein
LGTLADTNEWIDQWFWQWSISLLRESVGKHGGFSLTGDSEGKMTFQGMGCRRFCRQVSISIGVPLENLGRGSIYREL